MKDQFIAYIGGGGVGGEWLTTYFSLIPLIILPKIFFFSPAIYGERFTSLGQILLSEFWNFPYQTYNINVLILSFGPNI